MGEGVPLDSRDQEFSVLLLTNAHGVLFGLFGSGATSLPPILFKKMVGGCFLLDDGYINCPCTITNGEFCKFNHHETMVVKDFQGFSFFLSTSSSTTSQDF